MKLYGLHLIFRIRVIFLALIVISLLVLLLNYPSRDDVRYCFVDHSSHQYTMTGLQRLEDVLLSDRKPTPGRSIFFHETSCHIPSKSNVHSIFESFGSSVHSNKAATSDTSTLNTLPIGASIIRLNPRQACAVESAALHNPNFDIFVLFASAAYSDNTTSQPLLDAVLSYSNVHMRKVNLWSYAADTPIYEWLKGGELFTSK